jgi:hypothetical protein
LYALTEPRAFETDHYPDADGGRDD